MDLANYTIAGHWDSPHIHVTCEPCLAAGVEHALFTRKSPVDGEPMSCIYPSWGDGLAVARYWEWMQEWGHWEIVPYETQTADPERTVPTTLAELWSLAETHEAAYHSEAGVSAG